MRTSKHLRLDLPGILITSSYVITSSWSKTALCLAKYLSRDLFFLRPNMEQLTILPIRSSGHPAWKKNGRKQNETEFYSSDTANIICTLRVANTSAVIRMDLAI